MGAPARRFISSAVFIARSGLPALSLYIQRLRLPRHGGWRSTRRIKLSISPDFFAQESGVVHTCFQNRVYRARAAGFGNRRTGWLGTNARSLNPAVTGAACHGRKIVEFPPTRVAMLTHLASDILNASAAKFYFGILAARNGPVADCQQSNFWWATGTTRRDDAAGSIPL